MTLDIHERDISPDLCRICGSCCRVTFRLRDTTPRYRRFLRQIGYALWEAAREAFICLTRDRGDL